MTINFSPLPIDDVLDQLRETLNDQSFALLVAAPGAGKTTRVPLALLDAEWRKGGRIIMLEPRRIAVRAAAHRMAQSFGEKVGETVGYRVRLDARVSAKTQIEVVTEGVFTRMILDDPELEGVAAVLFDEFHERSLDGDLGLALALDAAILRPELRILIMSATLDSAQMSKQLADAPLIESEGRAFPVETIYAPSKSDVLLEDHLVRTVLDALDKERGSILVFLPGQAEIRRVAARLSAAAPDDVDVAPLYGRLTPDQQDLAIAPAKVGRRKVVLATSIAQTSLTIEGIRVVVDSGLARVPVYEPATALTRLETRTISQAAATQRQGRAGRVQAGVCYRLWAKGQNAARPAFDTPEILAADLTSLVLNLARWGVSDPKQMQFVDQPPTSAWAEAVVLLKDLDALDESGQITAHGRALVALPIHPRLAHMIQKSAAIGYGQRAADIAALVSEHGLGGEVTDLENRLQNFLSDRSGRANEAKSLARRWAKQVGGGAAAKEEVSVGRLIAYAYPDRIAQAAGKPGRFRLANGRAAALPETDRLAQEKFLVVTDITGQAANGRIRAAARIDLDEIEADFSSHIVEETRLEFDASSRSVRARRVRAFKKLILADAPTKIEDFDEAARMLCLGIQQLGVESLPWTKAQKAMRGRATYLHTTLGAPWPDLSDLALQDDVTSWLAPCLSGVISISGIEPQMLDNALMGLLPWNLRNQMDQLLPSHFEAPTGSRIAIDYGHETAPAIEVRVQELFGLTKHPAIADGKIPLLVILLSPAHRPIQMTRDLPGFWRGSWADAAKDLKGRYPRHFWPDDPVAAKPTSRAKPNNGSRR
ncbi:ATP-dependent helicase HrpB [Maritalea porphyrae]|uniref:ATP-dependent helicase n=1 Tax=Maritalea porphyrae TaxID=880732 RepID=A0ABQ5UMZ3_9HYPH|nr:ATP-dependent helicase HrpB [Maritalea porphyrae]GLQ16411.1 ATP-dependent helicase [Maritalea porphyrae]